MRELQLVCAYAFAAAEQNAANGTIVTAPTCGSCGVVPAVSPHEVKSPNDIAITIARNSAKNFFI